MIWTLMGLFLLVPQVATAQMESSALWWSRTTGQCQDASLGDYSPVVVAEVTPCDGLDDSDPAHNVCFEGAPAPVSTFPHLLAKWQAELATARMLQTVSQVHMDLLKESSGAVAADEPAYAPVRNIFFSALDSLPRAPESALMCYANPEQCRSLPAVPTVLSLTSLTPVFNPSAPLLKLPPQDLDDPGSSIWARLRVGPSLEHRLLPDQPPRWIG
ncbi:MAG: hypothetical protein ACNA8W_05035 [Bradymonadaceae bacterium]